MPEPTHIREASPQDAAQLLAMMRALAVFEGYADALQRFCEDDAFRSRAGAAGHAAAATYQWERINDDVLAAYLKVIARRAADRGN